MKLDIIPRTVHVPSPLFTSFSVSVDKDDENEYVFYSEQMAQQAQHALLFISPASSYFI